jgi:CRISPR/Cas system-associated protein Cas10 (large subunit of type III CRISPR-Cas system)
VAPWDSGVTFAKTFQEKFTEYTCNNPALTLSAGIFICGAKFPIGRAINAATSLLEDESKKGDKNKITVFGDTVNWKSNADIKGFNELFSFGKDLETFVEENEVSMSFVYYLLQLWHQHFEKKEKEIEESEEILSEDIHKEKNKRRLEIKSYVPYYKYKLARTVKRENKETFDKLDKKWNLVPWAKIPVSWVSLRKR